MVLYRAVFLAAQADNVDKAWFLVNWISVVFQTSGTVFPSTDRPRPANDVFIFFFHSVLCKQFLC